jgi:hypothetical protein
VAVKPDFVQCTFIITATLADISLVAYSVAFMEVPLLKHSSEFTAFRKARLH